MKTNSFISIQWNGTEALVSVEPSKQQQTSEGRLQLPVLSYKSKVYNRRISRMRRRTKTAEIYYIYCPSDSLVFSWKSEKYDENNNKRLKAGYSCRCKVTRARFILAESHACVEGPKQRKYDGGSLLFSWKSEKYDGHMSSMMAVESNGLNLANSYKASFKWSEIDPGAGE